MAIDNLSLSPIRVQAPAPGALPLAANTAPAPSIGQDQLKLSTPVSLLANANSVAAANLCMAYYLLRRYTDAVEACDRCLSRNPGRNTQLTARSALAATYAELGRSQDAMRERAVVARLSPFLTARTFAAQLGTEEAASHVLEGMKKAGFR